MSALFFKRFLKRPFQIASIIPSSRALVERVADKIDFDHARVIAEYGPGEGVHSREIARRMRPDCQLLLFELEKKQLAIRSHSACDFTRSEEHTSELQSPDHLVCRLLLEKKKQIYIISSSLLPRSRTYTNDSEAQACGPWQPAGRVGLLDNRGGPLRQITHVRAAPPPGRL